ncbi:MAG: hypothetical protein ACHQ15_02195 [Candidatus Limnocylindrales bacterium]
MVKFIGGVLLLGFLTVAVVSLVQAFVISVPAALILVAAQGLLGSIVLGTIVVLIVQRSARSPESRVSRWARPIVGPNGRYVFAFLVLAWTGFMYLLASLPPEPNGSPSSWVGGMALLGLFAGTFIFLGFVWSVISE